MRARWPALESLAALGASTVASVVAAAKLLRPDWIQEDALVHQYWMRRFQDPRLFNDALTAQLLGSQRYPDGYEQLFRLASQVVDPVAFGEWLGVALMAVSGWLIFRIVREHTAWRPAAWIAGALFLALTDLHRFYGGFARAFVQPAVLLTVLLAMRGRHLSAALVASGAALFYPPAALLAVGMLIVSAARWRDRRPWLDPRRARYALLALAIAVVAVVGPELASGGSPEVLTEAQARAYPEFQLHGTLQFFVPSTLKYLTQNRSGFDLRASGSILALAALALLLIRPANIRLLRAEVLALLVVALAAYALAQLVLFRLYLPHRYTYPLLAFLAIAVGVLVRPGWEAMWSRPRRRLRVFGLLCAPLAIHLLAVYAFPFGPTRAPNGLASPAAIAAIGAAVGLAGAAAWVIDRPAWTSRVVVGAVLTGVTLLAAVLSVPGRRTVAMQCAQRPVARYLETLPASAVIAGDPRDMPCIPLTARRPVVISAKLAPSYEARYFRTSRARMFAMLRAYYGRSPAALVDLATRYGATHVWVRRTAVRAEATPGGVRWRKRRTRPYGAFVRRLLRDGPPAVLHLPTSCRRWSRGSSEVFDIRCIAAERDRAPVDGSARLPARGAPTDYSPRPLADSDARAG